MVTPPDDLMAQLPRRSTNEGEHERHRETVRHSASGMHPRSSSPLGSDGAAAPVRRYSSKTDNGALDTPEILDTQLLPPHIRDLLKSVARGPVRPFQAPSMAHLEVLFADVATASRQFEGLSASTIGWVRCGWRSFFRFVQEREMEDAFLGGEFERQRLVLEAWVGWMRDRGLSRTAINTYWRALRFFIERVAERDHLSNPLVYLRVPRPNRPRPRCIPPEAAGRLLEFVRGGLWPSRLIAQRNLAIVGLMLFGGLRRGEVRSLDCGDVNLEAGVVLIRRGKGRDGGKDRRVMLSPQLRRILSEYLATRRMLGLSTPPFLVSGSPGLRLSARTIQRLFALLRTKLGFRVSPHMLRHTAVNLLRQQGVPDRLIMDQLGHSDIRMLQRYSHADDGERALRFDQVVFDLPGFAPGPAPVTPGGVSGSARPSPRPKRGGSSRSS